MPIPEDLKNLAQVGAGMIIDSLGTPHEDIKNIVVVSKAPIIIKNASSIPFETLKNIAMAGKGNAIFDFTD